MKWICGDIHGMFHTARGLVEAIDGEDPAAELIFVGDYVDRGPHSAEVVDYLVGLQRDRGAICLRGNHDDVIDWFLNGTCESDLRALLIGPINELNVLSWWMENGFAPTLVSYGLTEDHDMFHASQWLRESVPVSHKAFFRGLPLYWSCETHFACHGWYSPGEPLPDDVRLDREQTLSALWSRFEQDVRGEGLDKGIDPVWGKTGVFGHTIVIFYGESSPIKQGAIRLVDTGAFIGGGLTGYCCEQDRFLTVPTDERDGPIPDLGLWG